MTNSPEAERVLSRIDQVKNTGGVFEKSGVGILHHYKSEPKLEDMEQDPFQPLISDFSRWLKEQEPTPHYLRLTLLDFGIYRDEGLQEQFINSYQKEGLASTLQYPLIDLFAGSQPTRTEITAQFFYEVYNQDEEVCRKLMQRIYNDAGGGDDEELEQYPLLEHLEEGIADSKPDLGEIAPRTENVYSDDEVAVYSELNSHVEEVDDEVLFVDPYVDEELIELYVHELPESVSVRILTKDPKEKFRPVVEKHLKRSDQEFIVKTHGALHDRMVFTDDRCLIVGTSLKDAGWKPTYIVEIDSVDIFRSMYEDVWEDAELLFSHDTI